MDNQELTRKIYEMVKNTVNGLEGCEECAKSPDCAGSEACPPVKRKNTLILTAEHGETCHPAMERLGGICALLCGYNADLETVGAVVLYGLSLENLYKLAVGCADNDFVKTAAQALLKGIPVFAVSEGIELLKYERGGAYYNLLYENMAKLQKCGVTIIPETDLASALNAVDQAAAAASAIVPAAAGQGAVKNVVLSKKVITESDVRNALANGAGEMLVGPKTIITSLAAEYAVKKSIAITRKP